MKILRFVGVAVLLLAASIPLFPAPQQAARTAASSRALTKAGESGQVVVCQVELGEVIKCEGELKELARDLLKPRCKGRPQDWFRQTMAGADCRWDSNADYVVPTAADLTKFMSAVEAKAADVQNQYLVAAGVVGALGLILILTGFFAGGEPNQRLYATETAPPVEASGQAPAGPGRCPFCDGEIAADARRCMHCWKRLDGKPD